MNGWVEQMKAQHMKQQEQIREMTDENTDALWQLVEDEGFDMVLRELGAKAQEDADEAREGGSEEMGVFYDKLMADLQKLARRAQRQFARNSAMRT